MTSNKSYFIKVFVLLISVIVLGISVTYAYFTLRIEGNPTDSNLGTAKLVIDTDLDSTAAAINNTKLILIENGEKTTKADKVEFYLTNSSTEDLDAEYFVYLKEVKLSLNLYSPYFKWELVKKGETDTDEEIINSGDFSKAVRNGTKSDGEEANVMTEVKDIELNPSSDGVFKGISLKNKQKDNLIFRIWLENDPDKNQLDLTNGSFEGKLYFEAIPVR